MPAIDRVAGDRALAWIDDMLGPAAWMWARTRAAATLLVPIDPAVGLARRHVEQLLDWVDGPGRDGSTQSV